MPVRRGSNRVSSRHHGEVARLDVDRAAASGVDLGVVADVGVRVLGDDRDSRRRADRRRAAAGDVAADDVELELLVGARSPTLPPALTWSRPAADRRVRDEGLRRHVDDRDADVDVDAAVPPKPPPTASEVMLLARGRVDRDVAGDRDACTRRAIHASVSLVMTSTSIPAPTPAVPPNDERAGEAEDRRRVARGNADACAGVAAADDRRPGRCAQSCLVASRR